MSPKHGKKANLTMGSAGASTRVPSSAAAYSQVSSGNTTRLLSDKKEDDATNILYEAWRKASGTGNDAAENNFRSESPVKSTGLASSFSTKIFVSFGKQNNKLLLITDDGFFYKISIEFENNICKCVEEEQYKFS